jgi:5-methylcytosine-specific restriction endonuclease McrA
MYPPLDKDGPEYQAFKAAGRRRLRVMDRDKYTCYYCGRICRKEEIEVDHLIPRSRGGKDNLDNLVTACHGCNQAKGDLLFDEWLDIMRAVLARHGDEQ